MKPRFNAGVFYFRVADHFRKWLPANCKNYRQIAGV